MHALCLECERLKLRIKETIHASIETFEAKQRLLPSDPVHVRNLTRLNEDAERIAVEDYELHIRAKHFTPILFPQA